MSKMEETKDWQIGDRVEVPMISVSQQLYRTRIHKKDRNINNKDKDSQLIYEVGTCRVVYHSNFFIYLFLLFLALLAYFSCHGLMSLFFLLGCVQD